MRPLPVPCRDRLPGQEVVQEEEGEPGSLHDHGQPVVNTWGEQLSIFGQEKTLAKAEEINREWVARLESRFLTRLASGPATVDEVARSEPRPAGVSCNVVGAMVGRLSRAGRIICVGIDKSEVISRHSGINRIWRLA